MLIDMALPDEGIESREDLMRAFISMYAYIPEARPHLLDVIAKTHGYQQCFSNLQGIRFSLLAMDPQISEAICDIQDFCEQGGATVLKRFNLTWKNPSAADLQDLLERYVLKYIGEDAYWRSLSLQELERWHPLLAVKHGFPELPLPNVNDWKQVRAAKHGQIYSMLKKLDGVERAVALAARGVRYDYASEAAWLPLEDLAEVFAGGSIDRLLAYPLEGPGQFLRKVSKFAIGLVAHREDGLDLLKGCERSTLAYWRKANYIDQVTWYRLVGATGKQADTLLAKDLGL
ncbi:hypothetical protein [Pseudomonas amygdali]|uniref:Uncharacterized protein n=1 Tax=Pseudomonas amygdali pv. lachrymans str. M301315 TaxID=629260 RepID=A0AAD0PX33_PSEAV|nr:hypothetical protein [Pseudomonas amygdali]AXH60332.1 hypothetical protein PLA107_034690 [Pseudomonas amygdali pv. lachrymans str. M301315]